MSGSYATPERLARPDGTHLAYHALAGRTPTVVFCGGFRSDMTGTKALALDAWAQRTGQGFVRFDYFAHGQSPGEFRDGTVGRWADDTLAIVDRVAQGPLVLIGSSMGGWLSLLAARARPQRLAGWLGIAPAPDFTEDLMLQRLAPGQRAALERDGILERPSRYSDQPDILTWRLIEEGRNHLVMRSPLRLACKVRLLHGQKDPDVPWEVSLRLAQNIESPDVVITLVKDGDHRLSKPADLARLVATVAELCES